MHPNRRTLEYTRCTDPLRSAHTFVNHPRLWDHRTADGTIRSPTGTHRDAEGKVYTVRYEAVNAMLLNEFLKEHRKVENLEATVVQQRKEFEATTEQQQKEFESKIAHQQKQIEALTAGLQKVSTQVEASRRSQQMVLNNQ